MNEQAIVIGGLALGTFAIRLGGYLLGASIPESGPWARALQALPGCLIAALLAVILVQAEPAEWTAASVALAVALLSRSLPLTMLAGVGSVWLLRSLT
ncbi:AzlD family protein [Roseivivax sp. THAF30]|uniref:AzlD family protein n=1 Tax=Roseivivax sp. THAF30 TaxID=2587852 RepID=UPI001268F26E|nr:AzlD domain-containing protein [Roseivivax sp. THAF30]QFT61763.1 Branched-chain amino acid transport protein (AzlD) [Roseivivax sp. THAF30]